MKYRKPKVFRLDSNQRTPPYESGVFPLQLTEHEGNPTTTEIAVIQIRYKCNTFSEPYSLKDYSV